MAVTISPKRRSTDAAAPTTANLADGEIAVNAFSRVIYQRIGASIIAVSNYFDQTSAQTAGMVYAAPSGAAGAPAFRSLVASDIPTLNQSTTGNAATATKLGTVRSITATGDMSWTVNFDGSGNATAAATIANNAVTLGKMATVSSGVLLGRGSSGTGNVEVLTLGTGLSISAGQLNATASGGSGGPIYASGTAASVTNSTTATDLVSMTIPGGTLGTNGAIRIRCAGRYKNNSGSAATLTLLLSFGGTTMWQAVTGSIASATVEHAFMFDIILAAANNASAQVLNGILHMANPAAATTGLGPMATLATATTGTVTPLHGTAAVASGADKVFKINAKHSVANANIAFTVDYCSAFLEGGLPGPQGPKGPSGGSSITAITDATTARTLLATDIGNEIQFTNNSAITVTVDPSVGAGGGEVLLRQVGNGQITVVGASGVTVQASSATLKSGKKGARMYVRMETNTLAYVGGEVAAS